MVLQNLLCAYSFFCQYFIDCWGVGLCVLFCNFSVEIVGELPGIRYLRECEDSIFF
jgi:hypothetical protein